MSTEAERFIAKFINSDREAISELETLLLITATRAVRDYKSADNKAKIINIPKQLQEEYYEGVM